MMLAAVLVLGYFLGRMPWHAARPSSTALAQAADKSEAVWVCPMHPEIMQDHPGVCPICGMDLVQAQKNHAGHEHGIQVDAATMQRLGVQLATAHEEELTREVKTYGTVALDQSKVRHVTAKFEGWIKKLHIASVGQHIQAGQVLYELYSPELIQRQREYLRLVERKKQLQRLVADSASGDKEIMMSLADERSRAREKLLYEDVDFEILREVEDRGRSVDVVPVRAAASGVITQINVREGSFVNGMTTIATLADLSQVWVEVAIYPDQLPWLKAGDDASVVAADSAEPIAARLQQINPVAEMPQRIASGRLVIANPQRNLLPGSYVDVTMHAQPRQALVVPRSAVMRSGRGDYVMLYLGDGHFLPSEVGLGLESGEWMEITDGLQPGAQVASNGQFLIDAAASLESARRRMRPAHAELH
ncbi:MAG: efflux RND transporter periplasmic adaptor subunit [Pseudomonadota bacterium]